MNNIELSTNINFPIDRDEILDLVEGNISLDEIFEEDVSYYDVLYDYYCDEMPYGVQKARTDDPYEWIYSKLENLISNYEVQ
jgi:hypothetical protein